MPKISLGTLYKIKQFKTQTWSFVEKTRKMDAWKYAHEDVDILKKKNSQSFNHSLLLI